MIKTRNITSYDTTIHKNELEKQQTHPFDYTQNFAKETIHVDFECEFFDHHETYHIPKKSSLICNCSKPTSSNSNSSL